MSRTFSGVREIEEPKGIKGGKQGFPPWAQARSNRVPVSRYYMLSDYVFNVIKITAQQICILIY
jgi:gamma-glutamylcysteine synthetase